MKKRIVWLMAVVLAPVLVAYASPAQAGAGVSIQLPGFGLSVGPGGVGLNVGLPWVVAPAPVPPPAYAYPDTAYEPAMLEDAPEFVQPPELGFYVAVGVPYDLYFYNNSYWVNRGNIWYSSAYYNGPWSRTYYNDVPYVFNRFPFERIRHYRDSYYGRYQQHGDWQGYNHFRPDRRNDFRGRPGSDRHDFAQPQYQDQNNRNRTDFRRPNSTWQGNGSGYATNRPPVRNSSAFTRSYPSGQVNQTRTPYYRTNDSVRRYDSRSTQISPLSFAPAAGNRPDYHRPDRSGQSYGNNYSNTRRYSTGQRGEQNRSNDYRNNRGDSTRDWQGERR